MLGNRAKVLQNLSPNMIKIFRERGGRGGCSPPEGSRIPPFPSCRIFFRGTFIERISGRDFHYSVPAKLGQGRNFYVYKSSPSIRLGFGGIQGAAAPPTERGSWPPRATEARAAAPPSQAARHSSRVPVVKPTAALMN